MVSGFLDFFSGRSASSDKKAQLFKQHIVPIVHHDRSRLSFEVCTNWVGKRVIFQLIKFERPQLGVIKYIGCDSQGLLCAGIEFDYDIGGMSGKVSGQKLFKCKPGHGLLVPVEYVQFLEDYENGTSRPSGSFIASAEIARTQSVPNLSGRTPSAPHPEEYIAVPSLPSGLKIGDNVVWLGGSNPLTGIVRWIGRSGRNEQLPVKAWVEMDEYLGFGYLEVDVGTKYGCAVGRGRFLPVDELILFENFFGQEDPESGPSPDSQQYQPSTPTSSSYTGNYDNPNGSNFSSPGTSSSSPGTSSSPRTRIIPITVVREAATSTVPTDNLIDFGPSDSSATHPQNIAEEDFNRILSDENNSLQVNPATTFAENDLPPSIDDILKEFSNANTASTVDDSLPSYAAATSMALTNPFSAGASSQNCSEVVQDENGNDNKSNEPQGAVGGVSVTPKNTVADMTVKHTMDYYEMPPFIVPPINIMDFFKATGPKGIQGKRNSCYIDVVLFSLFAFTESFDQYFLDKSTLYTKGPDSELTRMAKKALAGQIVNPLRQNYYVSAAGINFLRDLIIPLSDKVDGAFLDVEEFMLIMFDKLFNLQEFINYDNNMKDYIHQVNLGDHHLPIVMTLKQCLELSMADYGLKLKEVPSPAFIIQIPRNTYGIIQSTTIVPNLKLDLESVIVKSDSSKPVTMNLVAVICIKEFHFVTFVKSGKGSLSHWVLFDSNPSEERPKVEIVPNMGEWLESLEHQCLTSPSDLISNKHKIPSMVQKLLTDIYVCIYCPS